MNDNGRSVCCASCDKVLGQESVIVEGRHVWRLEGKKEVEEAICTGPLVAGLIHHPRHDATMAQGRMAYCRVDCTCGCELGWKFLQDLESSGKNQGLVGSYGLVKSRITIRRSVTREEHGEQNECMIRSLRERVRDVDAAIWEAFRKVPRGYFVPASEAASAYQDTPIRTGKIHLSAPHMYALQLHHLALASGHSFLDLGCGSGWFTAMAGTVVGERGRAFGCDISEDIVTYSQEHIERARASLGLKLPPAKIFVSDAFFLSPAMMRYDRVLCGAECPADKLSQLESLLKIGGIMVVPVDNELLQVTRTSDNAWSRKVVCVVRFAKMVVPPAAEIERHLQAQNLLAQSLNDSMPPDMRGRSLLETLLAPTSSSVVKRDVLHSIQREFLSADAPLAAASPITILASEAAGPSLQRPEPSIVANSNHPSSGAFLAERGLEIAVEHLNVEWTSTLGQGAQGSVHRGSYLELPVAIKTCSLVSTQQSVRNLQAEVTLLASIRHPHIVQLIGFSRHPISGEVLLVTELLYKSLDDAIHSQPTDSLVATPLDKLRIARQISLALNYLHTTKGVHRDLKPANILLDHSGNCKVADFGLAKILQNTLLSQTLSSMGTPLYLAPESFGGGSKGEKNMRDVYQKRDVYSFAILLWELFSLQRPYAQLGFGSPFELAFHVKDGGRPEPAHPPGMPDALFKQMTLAWDANPMERPSFADLLQVLNPLFSENQKVAKQAAARKRTEEVDNECGVCMNAPRDAVFLNCGHIFACFPCASAVRLCPVCRSPFEKVQRVFM